MAAFIGPLIGAGASLIGSFLGGKTSGASATGKKLNEITGKQEGLADTALAGAQKLMGKADTAIDPALAYETKLLGSRQEGLQAINAPSLLEAYDVRRKQLSKDLPRGGGTTRLLANLPFQAEATLQSELTSERGKAAGALSELGTKLAALGISEQDVAERGFGGIIDSLYRLSALQAQSAGSLGASIGKIIAGMFTKGSSGGGPDWSSATAGSDASSTAGVV